MENLVTDDCPAESPGPYQQVDKAFNPGSKIISMITNSDLTLNAFLVFT